MPAITTRPMEEEIQEFAEYLRQERMRSPRTVARYREVLRDFGQFLTGLRGVEAASVDTVDKDMLSVFLRRKDDREEPSRTSWNSRLAALRAFYGFRVKRGRLAMNPAMAIDRLKVHSRAPVPLSLAEIVALAIAAVAAEYGLRLAYIEPALVARVLTESRGNGLGARPFEYHAGALFSPAFADAAQSGDEGPFHLAEGPPVACQPDRPPEEKS